MSAPFAAARGGRPGSGDRPLGWLLALCVLGIVFNLAVPAVRNALLRGRATAIVADFEAVREASLDYRAQTDLWPREQGPGEEPTELGPYLRGRLQWRTDDVLYDWQNWLRPGGRRAQPELSTTIGFTVQANDERLLEMIGRVSEHRLERIYGWGVTFPIETGE